MCLPGRSRALEIDLVSYAPYSLSFGHSFLKFVKKASSSSFPCFWGFCKPVLEVFEL